MTCLLLIPLLPFIGFLVNATSAGGLSKAAARRGGVRRDGGSFLVSLLEVGGWRPRSPHRARWQQVFTWISSGDFTAAFTLRVDPLAAVMILSSPGSDRDSHLLAAYMHEEARGVRALLLVSQPLRGVHAGARARLELSRDVRRLGRRRPLLVSADWLLVSEEVGVGCGKKAFIVNRIGDF